MTTSPFSVVLAVLLTVLPAGFVRAEGPIVLKATDFTLAAGTPTLQVWPHGHAAVPVWSLSGRQVGQAIVATTPSLPAGCRAVKIELLVVGNEKLANGLADVYRVDLAELCEGVSVRSIAGKPVRTQVPERAWTPRRIVVESAVVVRGGSTLALTVRRLPEDAADTCERPSGLVSVIVTPLPVLPEPSVVERQPGYNSWPMIESVGGRLVCTYSRGSGHSIAEGRRNAFARTSSDGGRTWTDEICLAAHPDEGEVMIGKGRDTEGAALFWVRCLGGPKGHHDLYRTRDGLTFEKIAEPVLSPFPMQITDIFPVGNRLMALWFATDYRDESNHAWGTLVSDDNGRTWQQRTVERLRQKRDLPTEPCVVNLGDGRLLGLARTECGGDSTASQFQLTSVDNGETWRKTRTNIRDVLSSSPSLLYEKETGLVYNYYYERGRKIVKRRIARANDVFERPFDWPPAEGVVQGDEQRPWDAGNVNATEWGGRHYLAYYSGNETNTTVYVAEAERPVAMGEKR